MLFDERRQIDVIPRFVFLFAAGHENQSRHNARHLDDGVQWFAAALRLGTHKQIVALVQKLREGMTGIDRQRREHRKNFLLKITLRPGRAFRTQLRDFADPNAMFSASCGSNSLFQRAYWVATSSLTTRRILLNVSVGLIPSGPNVARFALDLLFDSSNTNFEKFVQV